MSKPLPDHSNSDGKAIIPGTPETKGGQGLLHVATQQETIDAKKKAAAIGSKAETPSTDPTLMDLERYLYGIFEDARRFKEDETQIQATMMDCLLRKNSQYDPAKLADIKAVNSSEAYLGVTGIKCRAFEAFTHDVYMNAKRKRTWTLKPTPIVVIPDVDRQRIKDEVMAKSKDPQNPMSPRQAFQLASDLRAETITREYELALKKAENMSRLIHDQLIEGGWVKAMSEGIMDLSTMKAMIIKGPILRDRTVRAGWKDGKITFESKTLPTFERTSPLDLYPSRYSDGVNGAPICEKISLDRSSLVENRKKDGYVQENIEHVALNSGPLPVRSTYATDREEAENKDNVEASPVVDPATTGSILRGIEYWTACRGKDLIEFGILKDGDGKAIDIFLDYEINAITIGNKIVFIEFNKDPMKRRPYSVTGFAKEIGGFWYRSIPEILKDPQDIVNAATRAMVNNLGWASGPQVIIPNINNLAPGEDIESLFPLKVWQGTGSQNNGGQKLVDFYQPDSRSAELTKIIEDFMRLADSLVEMPSYTYGNDKVAGAGRTSGGLSMLMSASSRGMKRVILDVDRNIFQNVITQVADYNLETSDDDSIKGDMNFYSEGVIALIMREQLSERRLGFLQATQNEFDMKIIGMDGRAKILADAIESLESDYDDIMPSPEKIEALIQQEEILQKQAIEKNQIEIQEAQNLAQREGELQMQEAAIEGEKLELTKREQDLEFKLKERELDIRAEKQAADTITKIAEINNENKPEPDAPAKKPAAKKEPASAKS